MKYVKLYENEEQLSKAELWYLASVGLWSIDKYFIYELTDKDVNDINQSYPNAKVTVDGYIGLASTELTKLPNGLIVGVSLDLDHSQITELPDGLIVMGDLTLTKSKLKKLPAGLIVGGNLYASKSMEKKIPADAKIEGQIYSPGR